MSKIFAQLNHCNFTKHFDCSKSSVLEEGRFCTALNGLTLVSSTLINIVSILDPVYRNATFKFLTFAINWLAKVSFATIKM